MKLIGFYIIFTSILLLGISCKENSQKTDFSNKTIESFYTELEIIVPEFVPSNYTKHQIINDSIFIGLNSFKLPNTLVVFDIKNQQYIKNINLDINLFKYEIDSFYAVSLDSIFLNSIQGQNYLFS